MIVTLRSTYTTGVTHLNVVRNFLHYTGTKDRSSAERSHQTPTNSYTSRCGARPCNPVQFSSYYVIGRIGGNKHLITFASIMRFGLSGEEYL